MPMVRVPPPSGPNTAVPIELFVLLPAMVRFVPAARLMPPVNVLLPLSWRLPPPLTRTALLAFSITELMIRVGWSGATFWLLKEIGLTVIVGVATLFRFTFPVPRVELLPTLFDDAVMRPLVIVRMLPAAPGVTVGAAKPPSLLNVRLLSVLLMKVV